MEFSADPNHNNSPQIVFDLSLLPERYRERPDELSIAFALDDARFDDELHTAVAKSRMGISPNGELNMQMLEDAKKAGEYLEGRQGQALIMVRKRYHNGELIGITGNVGVIADSEKPLGLHTTYERRDLQAGILVDGDSSSFSLFRADGEFHTTSLRSNETRTIPLSSDYFAFGEHKDGYVQEVIAGDEIVPWIIETLGDGQNGYDFYSTIIRALVVGDAIDHSQLDSLLVEPFLSMMVAEREILVEITVAVSSHKSKVESARKILEGANGEANLALSALYERYSKITNSIPQTRNSYPVRITQAVDSPLGAQSLERTEALKRRITPLNIAINRDKQKGN